MKRILALICCALLLFTAAAEPLDYSDPARWAYYEQDEADQVDVFFIAPSNVSGSEDHLNANMDDPDEVEAIRWSIAMQTGIYGTEARFFSLYSERASERQPGLK